MSNDKGSAIVDVVIAGTYEALGLTVEEANRFYLRKVAELQDEAAALTTERDILRQLAEQRARERDQARMEAHRLRELNQRVDVRHIRLRDGLRRALGLLEHRVVWSDMPRDQLRDAADAAEIAELRKLVTP